MADLVIKNMKMPKDQPILIFIWPDGQVFPSGLYKSEEWDGVEAISLPEGHGKMIDADALKKLTYEIKTNRGTYQRVINIVDLLNAPTIIPAEGRKTDGDS